MADRQDGVEIGHRGQAGAVTSDLFVALVLFAIVASITPGPNNTMLMASGANFGLARTVPHMMGVWVGFVALLLAIGLGLGGLFAAWPALQGMLQVAAVVYLIYLAWKLASAKSLGVNDVGAKPQTFGQAVAFQWVNPKAWTMALSAFGAYAPKAGYGAAVLLIVAVFAAVTVPCALVWTGFGVGVRRFLGRPAVLRAFNIGMALLLLASMYPLVAAWLG